MKKHLKITGLVLTALFSLQAAAQQWTEADPANINLAPQQNAVRQTKDLSGIWNFQTDPQKQGEEQQWQNGLTHPTSIAVPGSWNDQFSNLHFYLEHVWYETTVYVPTQWKAQEVFLHFGAATYQAKVWINGSPVGMHQGGNLPFSFCVTDRLQYGKPNRITVQVENEQYPWRVPTGKVAGGPSGMNAKPAVNYDFFPYGGLHRAVTLYTVPRKARIHDVTVLPSYEGTTGKLTVLIDKKGADMNGTVQVQGHGADIRVPFAAKGTQTKVDVQIPDVKLWDMEHPNLYTVTVTLGQTSAPTDQYELQTGVRTVSVTENQILLNGKPVYLKGFGKHEDFPVYGRGYTAPVMVKDYSLMKWCGANSYRTSHYPYDESYYTLADREGFLIIDEIPAVGLLFGDSPENNEKRLRQCSLQLTELIKRDKNHPSVIMWSVANEPSLGTISDAFGGGNRMEGSKAAQKAGKETLDALMKQAKEMDPTRLACYVDVQGSPWEWMENSDVICINRYYGWYNLQGELEAARRGFSNELDRLYERFHKPILVTEFGGDCIAGEHSTEDEIYTEEYQKKLIEYYLDVANEKDFVVGMHIWNFADFRTGMGLIRVGGKNLKGIFTQDRKPKMSATMLHERWPGARKY